VCETNLLGNFIFELGVGRQDFAAAAAVSILVLALTILLSWPYVRSLLKEDAA
jgi:N,N'-diacetylchitobiose transport system permease protein